MRKFRKSLRNAWKWLKRRFDPPKERNIPAKPELPNTSVVVQSDQEFTPVKYRGMYRQLWDTMKPNYLKGQKKGHVGWYISRCRANKALYEETAEYIKSKLGSHVPWEVIAVLHGLEASFDLDEQILNGEDWDERTRLVPKGHGPWDSWKESALTGFKIKSLPTTWDLVNTLHFCERWNGTGYLKRGKNSPYIWSYSNHYAGGKYVRDHKFDSKAISKQVGAAVMLKELGFDKVIL